MQQHSIPESRDGSQGEDDNYQAEGEGAMQQHSIEELHRKRQLQSSIDALHKPQAWGRRALKGRRVECPHGAIRTEDYQKIPYGFMIKDGSPMPRCKGPECVEKMKISERSEMYQDTSKHSHGMSAGGEGSKEINKGSTMMVSCAQPGKHEAQVAKETNEQKWKKVIELLNNITEDQVRMKYLFDTSSKHRTQRELQKKPRQQGDFQKDELQKKPRQQDDFEFEIQAAIERQQKTDNQIKYHRKSQEEVLGGLPMTTTTNNFQRFIRAERDKQHMYTQDQD